VGEVFFIGDRVMDIDQAIELLKITVKNNGTTDNKHIDLGLVSTEDRPKYEKALIVAKLAILEGKITQDEFNARLHLN
jgi:hypothetical protein